MDWTPSTNNQGPTGLRIPPLLTSLFLGSFFQVPRAQSLSPKLLLSPVSSLGVIHTGEHGHRLKT